MVQITCVDSDIVCLQTTAQTQGVDEDPVEEVFRVSPSALLHRAYMEN